MDYTKRENNRVEVWKDIRDYEGLYQASNLGRMRSLDRWVSSKNGSMQFIKGRILKLLNHNQGYLSVGLCKNNKVKTSLVHRIIAETFLPNSDNLPCVNHKDEDKTNNNVNNLEWCNSEYNNAYGTRTERCCKPVLQYTIDGKFVREWPSAMDAERNGGFSSECIYKCCKGKIKKHQGCIWRHK